MPKSTVKTRTVQAQYYSHMDFDHETVGWRSVSIEEDHKTLRNARRAIKAHKKKYPVDDREFRIVTTTTFQLIEDDPRL